MFNIKLQNEMISTCKFLSTLGVTMLLTSASYANGALTTEEEDPIKKKAAKQNKNGSEMFHTSQKAPKNKYILREVPGYYFGDEKTVVAEDTTPFKPSISAGAIVHMMGTYTQAGFGPGGGSSDQWNKGFQLYRARILLGGQLSKKGSFFMETEIPSIIGTRIDSTTKNVKVSPIILDCQYEYKFSQAFTLISGMQLVSHNRNGLQGAASLLANDFTFFQYPYNLFANQPLQGNFGRDLGVNARGYVLDNKLEYRIGVFTGRRFTDNSPFRTVGRLVYNFLDADQDYYYSGTKLGNGKTLALGAGFDVQGTYSNVGADVFLDVPAGNPGSITVSGAFSYMTGGNSLTASNSFVMMIPKQTTQLLEVGYYFKDIKLQPYIRYENQSINAESNQYYGTPDAATFNKVNSSTVFGGGLNYFFNGYGSNLRLSYTSFTKGVYNGGTDVDKKSFGQIWLQLQFFIF